MLNKIKAKFKKEQSILGPFCLFKKKLNHRYKNRSFFLTKNTARSPYNLNVYEEMIEPSNFKTTASLKFKFIDSSV